RILLDQQGFIGNFGWRQNEQTFDAILVQAHDGENSRFTYGYIDRVARVFGKDHPAGRFDSSSHIANASTELPLGGAGGYAYLLRFDNAPASSGDTFGLWFRPSVSSATTRLSASIESAWQVDNSASTPGADFGHYYFRTDVGATFDPISAGAGFERL